MARVKIKHPSPCRDTKLSLLDILGQHDIYAARIIPLKDGYLVITSRDEEVDTVFNNDCADALKENDFTAVMPPDLRAKRTVLLFGIDEDAYAHSPEELINEIYRVNEYTINSIDSVYKFPNSKILKITFRTTAPALRALDLGVKFFNTRVPPHQVQQEEFHALKNCMRCYKIEEHVARDCDMPKEHKVCSECAAEGHTWRDCPSNVKKCLNCGGAHRTLAFKCPLRRAAVAKAKEEAKNKPTSYSQAASAPFPLLNSAPQLIPAATGEKIYTAVLIALAKDAGEPGSFEGTLNRLLERNNIAPIVVGEELNSRAILGLPAAPTTSNQEETTNLPAHTSTPTPPPSTPLLPVPTSPTSLPEQTPTSPTSLPELTLPEQTNTSPTSNTSSSPSPTLKKEKPKNKNTQPTHLINPNLAKTAILSRRDATLLQPDMHRQTRHSNKNKHSTT